MNQAVSAEFFRIATTIAELIFPTSLVRPNAKAQRAGAKRVDFKTDPTAGSVACDGYALSGAADRGLVLLP